MPISSKPKWRAISSMTSISCVQSGLKDGIVTTTLFDLSGLETSKPIGESNSRTRSIATSTPSTLLIWSRRKLVVRFSSGRLDVFVSAPPSWTTKFGHVRLSSCANLSAAARPPYASTPRSNRNEASVRNPSRETDAAIPSGSNQAISSASDVVVSLICDPAPPMIPAIPTASFFASQINRSCALIVRETSSRVTTASPSLALRTINPSATFSKS